MKNMIRRVLPHPLLTLAIAVIWLLLNNALSPGHLVFGLLLGAVLPIFTRAFWPRTVALARPRVAIRLLALFVVDVLLANLSVARRVVADPGRLRPAFVVVPIDLQDDVAVSLLANIVCLTPGTVSAQLSADRRELLVHTLDCPDPVALVAEIKSRFEAPLKEVFAC